MLKVVCYTMKKIILFLIFFVAAKANAQINPDGTVINSFSATDINNNFFSSTNVLNNGKHMIIDFSATWCSNCWNYHGTKALDNYYTAYGPSGTLAQDAEVLFYEADPATNSNDLNGVGTNTVGDWVTGSNYLIFNEDNPTTVKSVFSANGSLGYPTVFLVCSDKKMYRLATNIVTATAIRSFVESKCGMTPLSANTIHSARFAYELFPNPTASNITLNLSLDQPARVSYALYNSVGQQVLSQKATQQENKTSMHIETANLQRGLYILQLQVGEEQLIEKIIVE